MVAKLLHKERLERIQIADALDHPWLSGANPAIRQMRSDAAKDGNDMMKFISYANVDAHAAQQANQNSRSRHGSNSPVAKYSPGSLGGLMPGQNMLPGLNRGPGSGNLPPYQQVNLMLDKKANEDEKMQE